ncbi:acyl carrier protein [Paenibacillus tyrfis]|uniref:acyl carrier protein n=1 Tax=Paenibacillus tyrfis TaxID=1501230 RepID=UPI0020A0A8AC|nr:acyl carrier protein [Paenibacillus tyrfis]MCP1308969.1 acyl carrier protein [Paenibacillus tyrfis]
MNREEIERKVMAIVAQLLGTPEVERSTWLLGPQGVLDSVTVVRLIAWLEQEFQVSFDEEDLTIESLSSVDRIVSFIEESRSLPYGTYSGMEH